MFRRSTILGCADLSLPLASATVIGQSTPGWQALTPTDHPASPACKFFQFLIRGPGLYLLVLRCNALLAVLSHLPDWDVERNWRSSRPAPNCLARGSGTSHRLVPTDQLGARFVLEPLPLSGSPNERPLPPGSCSWRSTLLPEPSLMFQSVAMGLAFETAVRLRAAPCARQAGCATAAVPEQASRWGLAGPRPRGSRSAACYTCPRGEPGSHHKD